MRVLFPLHGFVAWNGGLDLVRSISCALQSVATERDLAICYAVPVPTRTQRLLSYAARRWHLSRAGSPSAVTKTAAVLAQAVNEITADHARIACDATPLGIVRAADEFDADIVFPTMLPLGVAHLKRIGYIFDFQHHHLPHYFSRRIRSNRDRRFGAIARDADAIIVNSRAVADDARRYLGMPDGQIITMPFSPYALPWWFDAEPGDMRERYGIGHRFLMVCNHFWVHKDHETALRAFAQIRSMPGNEDLELALTGDPVDHRDPLHYRQLVDLVAMLGLSRWVHFLGLIPKRHQLALLRGCEALLQPSRFEGGPGGGSVAEAIGLGVPAIVSDIPVNLEIDVGDVTFFRTGDPADLARAALVRLSSVTTRRDPEASIAAGRRNLSRLGHAVADGILLAAGSRDCK